VAAPSVEHVNVPPTLASAEPERPPLALIGAVVGDSEAIAVFVDRTNQKTVRLRQGETHAGWLLSSVLRREVTLTKADRTETIALKSSDVPVAAGAPVMPMPTAIGAGPTDNSYAPFVPRSTPKNGEHDGL
jgi:general secretion pathway protein N